LAARASEPREHLADHVGDGIQYKKVNEWYRMTLFETEIESWAS
jgi:hypothetical protein